eukprot:TRINITY_DN2542_c1_g1_i3.p2 TRINITY_DN2542_c1_g1~~TRINITY_DN2542_c1_g1_i3.p2  ORF type:complete len:156 (-),score=35.99 TRINITY_DN2542_c1_g1_i3:27-494(-)
MSLNLFTALCWWVAPKTNSKPGDFVVALFWFLFGVPASFMWSYQTCYTGAKKGSAAKLLWYVVTWGMTIAIMVLMVIGIPVVGSAGIVMLIDASKDNDFVTIMAGICTGLWGISALYSIYVWKRVWSLYRNAGGAAQAEKEVKTAAAKEVVSQAV